MKQYQADFSLNRNKEVFVLLHLCPVHEVSTLKFQLDASCKNRSADYRVNYSN